MCHVQVVTFMTAVNPLRACPTATDAQCAMHQSAGEQRQAAGQLWPWRGSSGTMVVLLSWTSPDQSTIMPVPARVASLVH